MSTKSITYNSDDESDDDRDYDKDKWSNLGYSILVTLVIDDERGCGWGIF